MSRLVSEREERLEMFPVDALMASAWYRPTADELLASIDRLFGGGRRTSVR